MGMLGAGPLPRYFRLREMMREHINSGTWNPGDTIPSERELSERYGVSRMTARHAVSQLVHEGLLYREQGRGTFVAAPRIRQQLMQLTGFSEDMQSRGQRPGARVLSAAMMPADSAAERLRIAEDQLVFRVSRLRLSDSEPLAIETAYLSFTGCEHLQDEDLERNSLYDLLRSRYGLHLNEADQEMEADVANEDESRLLRVDAGTPVLRTRRVTYADHNRPVEYAEAVYLGSKYRFYVHLVRDSLATGRHQPNPRENEASHV